MYIHSVIILSFAGDLRAAAESVGPWARGAWVPARGHPVAHTPAQTLQDRESAAECARYMTWFAQTAPSTGFPKGSKSWP